MASAATTPTRRITSADGILALLIGAGTLLLYVATLAPTVLWGDDAYFQRTAFTGELRPDGGGHWLWLQAAQLIVRLPWGDVAYRANLLSALAAAATIVVLFVATRAAGLSRQGAFAAGFSLAISHTFWMHAVRAEVYTVFTFLLALQIALWFFWRQQRTWPPIAAAVLFGLTLLGHQMALLLLPAWAFLLWKRRHWLERRQWLVAFAALLLGLLPFFAVLRLQIMLPTGAGWLQALRLYFTQAGADFSTALFAFAPGALPADAAMWLTLLVLQFVGPALVLLLWGLWAQWSSWRSRSSPAPPAVSPRAPWQPSRPRHSGNGERLEPSLRSGWGWAALLIFYATTVLFAFSYRVNDRFVFYLPGYLVLVFFVGAGWDAFRKWLEARRQEDAVLLAWPLLAFLLLVPALTYYVTPRVLATMDLNPLGIRELPGREPNRFFLWPSKQNEWGARDYGEQALELLPQASVLVADHTPLEPLRYLQEVEGKRPDVLLIKIEPGDDLRPIVNEYSPDIPVFLADDNPDYYAWQDIPGAQLEAVGVVWKLEN